MAPDGRPATPAGPQAPTVQSRAGTRPFDGPVRVASAPTDTAGAGVPYPLLVLATLAGLLVLTAAAAAVHSRRR